jgi:nucleoid-associated protein YgaU
MLRELAAREPKAKAARPEAFVDLTFINELDSSEFIDDLYKNQPAGTRRGQRVTRGPVGDEKSKRVVEKTRSGVAVAKSVASPPPGESATEYTVEPGDTLSHLALWYYGDAHKWEKIYEANKETIKNPDYIYIGQRILIPS